MSKRFTDTEKWKDPWFQDLSTEMKMFFFYVVDNCDLAGIWKVNFKHFFFMTGYTISRKEVEIAFCDRIVFVSNDIALLTKFITFQYGEKAMKTVNLRKGIIKSLNYNKIQINHSPMIGLLLANDRPMNMDMDQDMDLDNSSLRNKITPDQVVDSWNKNMGNDFGYCAGLGSNRHLHNCLESIKYLPSIPHWEKLFDKCRESDSLTGKGKLTWTVNLIWLVDYDNALKVLSDNFDDQKAIKKIIADTEAIVNGGASA